MNRVVYTNEAASHELCSLVVCVRLRLKDFQMHCSGLQPDSEEKRL